MLISLFDLAVMYVRGQHVLHLHIFSEITLPLTCHRTAIPTNILFSISKLYIIHRVRRIKGFV